MTRFTRTVALAVLAAAVAGTAAAASKSHHLRRQSDATRVVVGRGQPVQIAFTAATADFPAESRSFENAVRMAIEEHPRVRGFPVQLNVVETRCGQDPDVDADDAAAAQTIAANSGNTAVIGNLCSAGFAAALSAYQAAGLTAITGSASADSLPSGTVLDRTVVRDGDGFAAWYVQVRSLPSDVAWQAAYAAEFGVEPAPLADLYFDAASLLLERLQQVASRDRSGNLVIDRAALAAAVRATTSFEGVSCTVELDPVTGNRLYDPAALAACAAG